MNNLLNRIIMFWVIRIFRFLQYAHILEITIIYSKPVLGIHDYMRVYIYVVLLNKSEQKIFFFVLDTKLLNGSTTSPPYTYRYLHIIHI